LRIFVHLLFKFQITHGKPFTNAILLVIETSD
jgi:hypothetical protein